MLCGFSQVWHESACLQLTTISCIQARPLSLFFCQLFLTCWVLCRLASFICGYEVFQIAVSSSYGVADFKENLLALYTKVLHLLPYQARLLP